MKADGTIDICPEGWRLYDAWTYAEVNKLPVGKLKRAYTKHRAACDKCDPIEKKTDDKDN